MAHVQKYAAANVAGLERHCLRRTDGHKNKDIDTTRTHLNYALDNNEKPLEYMQKRLGEIRVNQRRDDVKVAASWAVTLPRDVTTKEETQLFFKTAHSFLAHRYGEKNVLWSRVHMDETTPHLHFCFIPVTPDRKHPGEEKLCAKDVLNRPELAKFHTELAAEMRRVFGREIGIETGKTERNLPLEQLKVKTKLDAIAAKVDAKEKELGAVMANRKTFVEGQAIAQKLYDAHSIGLRGKQIADIQDLTGKQAKVDAKLLKEAIDYIWNSGGKDAEIAKLKANVDEANAVANKAKDEAIKSEAYRANISKMRDDMQVRAFRAESQVAELQQVVDTIADIAPDVHRKALQHVRERERSRGVSR